MYWNSGKSRKRRITSEINRNMRCIEISISGTRCPDSALINRNMRCIEIRPLFLSLFQIISINRNMRCIEICHTQQRKCVQSWINRNMRCIEISGNLAELGRGKQINRNMRCIEICYFQLLPVRVHGLIETWDVLKWWCDLNSSTTCCD